MDRKYVLTENYCDECDEMLHQVFFLKAFRDHKVGAVICPKCGHVTMPCNECEDHGDCGNCPWGVSEASAAMSDEAYMRFQKSHEPKIYKKFKDGEMGDHFAKVIKKIEGV